MKRKPNPITAFPAQPFPRPAAHSRAAAGSCAARSRPLAPTAELLATSHQPLTTTHSARRGVLLLVVLSLLLLFSMVAVTFVLVAGRHYETTRYSIRHEQVGDDPRQLLDEVFAQCIRGTYNPQSVIGPHSLLEDEYGNDGIKYDGTTTATPLGPLLTITFTPAAAPAPPPLGPTTPPATAIYYSAFPGIAVWSTPYRLFPFSEIQMQTTGYFNSQVFTAIGGAADRRSTRIVGWSFSAGTYTVSVLPFDGLTSTAVQSNPPTGFVINGRPFSGTGFGFNPNADPATDETLINAPQSFQVNSGAETVEAPYALLPNPIFFDGQSSSADIATPPVLTPDYPSFGGLGGADEDYDAADPQNMLLAHIPLNVSGGGTSEPLVPSLHRPETATYVETQNQMAFTASAEGAYARRLIERQANLRPTFSDHRRFPRLTQPNVFDVDNDGDGVTDSVWVDAGLPVRTAPDGRTYKPMVAILCVDLDGRLNVNAHGNVTHLNNNFNQPINAGMNPNETLANYAFSITGVPNSINLPRGIGTGPAEINLTGIFPNPATLIADYTIFLQGGTISGTQPIEGRYGEFGGNAGGYGGPLPGRSTSTPMGADDYLAKIQRYGRPVNYFGGLATGYNSPGDLWGRMALGLDYAGQPVYSYLKAGGTGTEPAASAAAANRPDDETPYDPYSVNLTRNRAAQVAPTLNDNLFSVAELERLLRIYDNDAAGLPDRLRTLLYGNGGTTTFELSKLITTDSNDVPIAPATLTRDLAALLKTQNSNLIPTSVTFTDLVRAKLASGMGVPVTDMQVTNALDAMIANRVIAPELIAGQKMDINRPFGNGTDDDGNGIVDEPDEYSTANEVPVAWSGITGFTPPTFMDLNRDGQPVDTNEGHKVRQEYAQQLYFLMMLVTDQTFPWAKDSGSVLGGAQLMEITSRQIAQWAINVVDFRDPDSIMTGFEYDANPFNGWDVDGDLSTNDASGDRRVVWGAEYPDLLLTETLALHDRRVGDSDEDTGSNNDRIDSKMQGPGNEDNTLDQISLPQGSAFFELYSTRIPNPAQHYPAELYTGGSLDLGKVVTDSAGVPWPVWRIAVTESIANPEANLTKRVLPGRHPDTTGFGPIENGADKGRVSVFNPGGNWGGSVSAERVVIFSTQPPAGTNFEDITFYNRNATPTLLQPGNFALIGPRPVTAVGTDGAGGPAAQRIQLEPMAEIYNAANLGGYFASNPNLPRPLTIICSSVRRPAGWDASKFPANQNIGVNVTEPLPLSYYTQMPTGMYDNLTNQPPTYTQPLDLPLDSNDSGSLLLVEQTNGLTDILHTGSKPNYKHALLQRLANPVLPYHQATNPYITVDWQPIPLVMFNGQQRNSADNGTDGNPFDRDDPNWGATPPASLNFHNHGRGLAVNVSAASFNPWNVVSPYFLNAAEQAVGNLDPNLPVPANGVEPYTASAAGTDVFPYQINHTLGYLNAEIGNPWTGATLAQYKNVPDPTTTNAKPFPWLTWHNRPYVSEAELMLVPAASAEEMLRKFTAPDSPATAAESPYNPTDPDAYHRPFKHLFNFRLSSIGTAGTAPNYARVLDYLHVPSPFIGTETILNPTSAPATVAGGPSLQAPFNRISHLREPGRVNINTIPGPAGTGPPTTSPVWDAIINTQGIPAAAPTWPEIVAARRGLAAGNPTSNTTLSTYFARPFRSAAGAAYALPGTTTGNPLTEIEGTFLRQTTANTGLGLFQDRITPPTQPYIDPVRNAYFHHQPLLRLRNLLTTRSNVYAIWITVGYFEVRPAPQSGPGTPYPDGYELLAELGSDTGETKRHRAFYIYDRTIPVAFERGQDHNFKDGLLLKRFIE